MSKLPKFLCVGAQKAGTTWLYGVLSQHPEVFLPRIKELLYFVDIPEGEVGDWRHRMVLDATIKACDQYIHHERTSIRPGFLQYILSFGASDRFTDEWYERVYSAAADTDIGGDITPEYMMMGVDGIEKVKTLLGDVKVILILRDPIERLWSQVRMVSRDAGRDPIEAYWDVSRDYACEKNSDYAKYVPIWMQNIKPENMGFFNFHALARNPSAFYRDVTAFLDLSYQKSELINTVIHQGISTDIPEDIMNDMRQLMAPQNQFMERSFGPDWKQAGSVLQPAS